MVTIDEWFWFAFRKKSTASLWMKILSLQPCSVARAQCSLPSCIALVLSRVRVIDRALLTLEFQSSSGVHTSEARTAIFSKWQRIALLVRMCMCMVTQLWIFPCLWGWSSPFFLLLIPYLCEEIAAGRTRSFCPCGLCCHALWLEARPACPLLCSAQFRSPGSLVPPQWRWPSCFNFVPISVEAVPDWKRLGREFQEGEN